jgi:iron complex outermembrane receptor protein
MKMFQPKLIAVAVAMAAVGGVSTPSFAQSEALEEIVTIGTRGKPRSATSSVAPVDVISASDFVSQGGVDTSNLLRNVVPSFNVNDQPISDAATLVRPANLRGLAPYIGAG